MISEEVLYKHQHAHLALPLAGLKGAMLIVAHHHSFVRRYASSVEQFVTVPVASAGAKDITGCRHIRCHRVMWC